VQSIPSKNELVLAYLHGEADRAYRAIGRRHHHHAGHCIGGGRVVSGRITYCHEPAPDPLALWACEGLNSQKRLLTNSVRPIQVDVTVS
jgi:hypothetical protein